MKIIHFMNVTYILRELLIVEISSDFLYTFTVYLQHRKRFSTLHLLSESRIGGLIYNVDFLIMSNKYKKIRIRKC